MWSVKWAVSVMLSRLAYSTVSVLLSVLPVPALLNDSKSILTWGVLFFLSVLFFVFYSPQEYSVPDYNFESTKIVEAWILSQCFPGGGCAVWICAGFSFHSWALLFGLESEGRIFWKFHSGLLNSLAERGHWAFVEKLCVWANLDSEHSFGVSCKKELQSEHQTHQQCSLKCSHVLCSACTLTATASSGWYLEFLLDVSIQLFPCSTITF